MNISDYLIDQSGKDWAALLQDWMPPLPSSFTLWLVNRCGDVFVVTDDEAVHMLDIGAGCLVKLADSRAHFAELLDHGDNASEWLMIPLVDRCRDAQMLLAETQCYGCKVPPMLGGNYDIANVEPTDLAVHYSLMADIRRQTTGLPDGTRIRSVEID